MNNYVLLFLTGIIISNYSQILLKKATLQKYDSRLREYANRYVITGYSLFVVNAGFNLIALKVIPLALASALESISYLIMLIFSRIFLGELITTKKVVGNFIIILGIVIFFVK